MPSQVKQYFSELDEITKDEFIQAWETEEHSSGHAPDQNALDRLEAQKQRNDLLYFKGVLNRESFENLVIPCHDHDSGKVKLGRQMLHEIVPKFSELVTLSEDACMERLIRVKHEIKDHIQESGNLLASPFVLGRVYSDRDLAMHGHFADYGTDKLYVGNTHRFIAFGVWAAENDFHPVNVYYCEAK